MREYFMYGSVRGAPGNRRSYRDEPRKNIGKLDYAENVTIDQV